MSGNQNWRTPETLVKLLNKKMIRRTGLSLGVDAFASEEDRKCEVYRDRFGWLHTPDRAVTRTPWEYATELPAAVFANPPWRKFGDALREAIDGWIKVQTPTVLLGPTPGNQKWFYELQPFVDIEFPNIRIQYEPPPGVVASTSRVDTAIYWVGGTGKLRCWDLRGEKNEIL